MGCSRARRSRNTPSAAIAWNTRGVTRITRFRKPNVDTEIPALISRCPGGPSTRAITPAAGAELWANPATPSTRRYARFASRYTTTTPATPASSARGSSRRRGRVPACESRVSAGARRGGVGPQLRAGRRRDGARARPAGAAADQRRDLRVHVWLPEPGDSRDAARVPGDGGGRRVSRSPRTAASHLPHAHRGDRVHGGVVEPARAVGHVRAAARLRGVRGLDFLRADGCEPIHK